MRKSCFIKRSFVALLVFLNIAVYSQNTSNYWLKSSKVSAQKQDKKSFLPNRGHYFQLDIHSLNRKLKNAHSIASKEDKKSITIDFPNIEGEIETFIVTEASVFQEELQQQFPEIRSYIGVNENSSIRFSISPQKGLSLTYTSGESLGFIERKNNTNYIVYKRSANNKLTGKFECLTGDFQKEKNTSKNKISSKDADDATLRTYLLALSVTAEYTEYHYGNTVGAGEEVAAKSAALAAMNATLTRVNGIFERDFSVRMQLINNINDIIYTDPATDPYSDYTSLDKWRSELQDNLTATITEENYDIGHLFGHDGGGGDAGCIGCVCQDNLKGSGYTSPANGIPEGDFFDIDYVSHEIGHQFGANHTWTTGNSGPENENTGANLEPGSGSTIMGYAGITTSNVQSQGDDYFHFKSIEQVTAFIKTTTCDTETTLTQNTPSADAGLNYTIPVSTAFILKGQGTSDGTTTFCWEQNDEGGNGGVETSDPSPTNQIGPMFRSFKPRTSPERYMPAFSSVLAGNLSTAWESVSSVARDLNFKLTVRDNIVGGGQNAIDNMTVTVDDTAGPFVVTSQNIDGIIWNSGGAETITWDVANTNSTPINTANVSILISTDDGVTFSTLVSNTPNDGSQEIIVPNTPAPFCRILIQPIDNIYYAVNSHTFSIDYEVITTCDTFSDSPNMPITDDSLTFDTTDIIVPGDLTVSDIKVTVDITHSYIEDLLIALFSPDGTQVNLLDRSCSDNIDLTVTFDDSGTILTCASPTIGTFLPTQSLSVLKGESGNGTWTIGINDNAPEDTGTLNSWSVEICSTKTILLSTNDFFSVYPNPSSESVNISLISNSNNDIIVSLIDMAGRSIAMEIYVLTSNRLDTEFNYGSVSQGIYVLKIEQGNTVTSKKIIVK